MAIPIELTLVYLSEIPDDFNDIFNNEVVPLFINGGFIGGFTGDLDGSVITNIASGSDVTIFGWSHDLTFSSSDLNTVAWTSGTLTLGSGQAFSIDAGNTPNMTALTYIYFDKGVSETVLQTSTTATDAVGVNKVLIAVAENSTTEALFQSFGGSGGNNIKGGDIESDSITANEIAANTITATQIAANTITASQIAADTITANELAANSVTATEINVASLAAITATMGTITTGTLNAAVAHIDLSVSTFTTGENITSGNAVALNLSGTVIQAKGLSLLASGVEDDSGIGAEIQDGLNVAQLDDDKFVWCGRESATVGTCIVGSVSAQAITWGTNADYHTTGNSRFVTVVKLDTDKFVLIFKHDVSGGQLAARAATVSGTTITIGTLVEIDAGTANTLRQATQLGTDKFALTYVDSAGEDATSVVCTVSGTTITVGTSVSIDTNKSSYPVTIKLDTDKYMSVWNDDVDNKLESMAHTVSGTTITNGAATDVTGAGESDSIRIEQVGTDKVFMIYKRVSDSKLYGQVATVSSTTITWGTSVELTDFSHVPGYIGLVKLTTNRYFANWGSGGSSGITHVALLDVTGTVPSLTEDFIYQIDVQNAMPSPVKIGVDKVAMAYNDGTDGVQAATFTAETNNFIGFATETITSGNAIDCTIGGIDPSQSGLTTGTKLYLDPDTAGAITTDSNDFPVGVAVSSTKILIKHLRL